MPITRIVIVCILATLAAGCVQNAQAPEQPVTVRKSPNDDRSYRYLVLPNKLRVLLVSDLSTDKAAAALAVYRGSFHEPEKRAGLAHFLEHMLFIQTEKYPEIDGFQEYVAANGGSTNAYTSSDHTNYFFDIQPAAFDEGLDRFAHFFISPIISAEYADREKNAVHSEYQMQIKDDGWRGFMVSKQALNPDHPASRFTIGSLETLAGDIQADLREFFETQYSADQMGLVVIADKTLDELETQIAPLFSQIENKDLGPAKADFPMYQENQLPAVLAHQTFKEGVTVTYSFPLPTTRPHYDKKPEQYFANLLGHEGTGSLYQLLSKRGWIESLSAGVGEFDHATSVLNVSMELTQAGDGNIPGITDLLFRYIDMLKASEPSQWLYDEQAQVAALGFRFQEKSNPTSLVYQLAPRLDVYPPEDLLVSPYLMEAFDADLIRQYLKYLRPDNVLMEYAAPAIDAAATEPWFSVPFTLTRKPLVRSTTEASFALPGPNPFLPERLELLPEDDQPIARADVADAQFWFDRDLRFGAPRASMTAQFVIEDGIVSARDRAYAQFYRRLVDDKLS